MDLIGHLQFRDFQDICSQINILNATFVDIIYETNQILFNTIINDRYIVLKEIDSHSKIDLHVRISTVTLDNISKIYKIINPNSYLQLYFIDDSIQIRFPMGTYGICTIHLKNEFVEEFVKEPDGL